MAPSSHSPRRSKQARRATSSQPAQASRPGRAKVTKPQRLAGQISRGGQPVGKPPPPPVALK